MWLVPDKPEYRYTLLGTSIWCGQEVRCQLGYTENEMHEMKCVNTLNEVQRIRLKNLIQRMSLRNENEIQRLK